MDKKNCRWRQFNNHLIGTMLSFLILVILMLAPEAGKALEVAIDNDFLTIEAERVPLSDVLHRLAESGVRIRIAPDIHHQVTARFQRRPLASGLAAILRPLNHSLIWETMDTPLGPVERLAEIEVFAAGQSRPAPAVAARPVFSIRTDPSTGARYVAHQIMIAFDQTMDPSGFKSLLTRIGGRLIDVDPVSGIYRVAFSGDQDIPDLGRQLALEPGVAAAEPNFAYRLRPALPNALNSRSALAPASTKRASEKSIPPVAVLDTGWRDDPAYTGTVVAAYDALAPEMPVDDTVGHGTQMALIASGRIHPAGTDPETVAVDVPVVAVRVFDENGYTSSSVLMRAIDFALNSGARVLSLSWGAETRSEFVDRAMQTARSRGAVIVAAAGNENTGQPVYPAAYEAVVGVGALNPDGTVWPRSNRGDFVSLLAPGFASLPVGSQGEAPGTYAGTSIAAAYTAGRLARALARNPEASVDKVLDELRIR